MNKYMKVAKELSEKNLRTKNGGPFGACIVKDGKVIGKGSNSVIVNNDPTAHAEIMAIREACKAINSHDLSGCIIYTSCFPCPMCLSAIIWANIKKVYYGNLRTDAKNIGFRDQHIHNSIVNLDGKELIDFECIDREETIKVFKEYVKKSDKVMY